MKFIKKIDFTLILLIAIFLLGLWLRLTNIDQLVWEQTGNDESRDMLVAEHIINYGEKVMRGPLAAGGFNWLLNSPIYFYFVTLIWSVTREPLLFMRVWALIMSTLPLVAYHIGKKILNKQLGLIAALMFAINVELIHESRQLLQPFLLPLFSSLFLLSLLKTKEDNNYFYLSAAIFFLLIQLHFHYGVLVILPIGLFLIAKYWRKLLIKDFSLKNVLIPIFTAFSVGILWLLLTYRKFIFDQLGFIILNFSHEKQPFLTKLSSISTNVLQMMFSWEHLYFSIPALVSLLLAAIFIKDKKSKETSKIVFLLASSAILMTISNGKISDTYLTAILPFFLILLSYGLYKIIKFNYALGMIVLAIITIRTFALNLYLANYLLPTRSYYQQKEEIAQVIYHDYFTNSRNKSANFALAAIDNMVPFDGWGTTGFWFHLEKMTQQKLTRLIDYGVNVQPTVSSADTIYLICDHRMSNSQTAVLEFNNYCLDKFTKVRNYLKPEPINIFQSKRFTVFKFGIQTKIMVQSYNYVYPENLKEN